MNNIVVIEKLVLAYNSSNARGFANLFEENVQVFEHPNILTQQSR